MVLCMRRAALGAGVQEPPDRAAAHPQQGAVPTDPCAQANGSLLRASTAAETAELAERHKLLAQQRVISRMLTAGAAGRACVHLRERTGLHVKALCCVCLASLHGEARRALRKVHCMAGVKVALRPVCAALCTTPRTSEQQLKSVTPPLQAHTHTCHACASAQLR